MRTDESLGRWPRPADVGVPLAVEGVQLSGTRFLAEGGAEPLDGAPWPLVAGSIVLTAAALVWRRGARPGARRRRRPVPCWLSAWSPVGAGTPDRAAAGYPGRLRR
ncbi:hypothetical protein [Actinomadura sp. NPDC049753]|uniref:hypothetical protein n=1 Tax=Actinomadura sp. NPDC049753 TaxID=3154739 RepID=UPI00343D7340